jgi:hypothetical protein
MKRATLIAAASAGFAIMLTAMPVLAQYGALAYDPDTRLWGRATDSPSPRDAEAAALAYCRSGGCRVVTRTGPGQCSAIAAANSGARSHWSTRPRRAEVEAAAVERCQYEAREPCHLVVVQCNR